MELLIDIDAVQTLFELNKSLMAIDHGSLAAFLETPADNYLKLRIRQRFQNEGDGASGNWLPLTPVTQSFRVRGGYFPEQPINRRTGKLFNWLMSMSPDISIMAYGGVQGIWPDALPGDRVTAKKYTTAQKGDSRTPARPVLAIDTTDMAAITVEMGAYLTVAMGQAWS